MQLADYFCRNTRYLPNTILWKRMFRRGRFSRVICHSQYVLNTAIRYGCDRAKLIDIPLCVDLPPESAPRIPKPMSVSDGPKIVTVGGIAHTKGTHDFLRALARLVKEFPNAHYGIIGEVRDKAYLAKLESMIDRLHLRNHASIIRSATEDQKSKALDEADLYVQPSHEEGFCLAYIEAAKASIVPLIAETKPDTGAIAAVSAGLPASKVVKPMNPAALLQAASELLNSPVPRDVFFASAREISFQIPIRRRDSAAAHLKLYELLGH